MMRTSRREALAVMGALAAGPATVAPPPSGTAAARTGGPRERGAIGDGQFRPLSTRYATLAAAQSDFPFATSLAQSLDGAAIQASLDAAEAGGGGRVLLPIGRFVLSESLRLPNQVTFEGESRRGSVIDNQNWLLDAPLIVNKQPDSLLYATLRNMTLHGGSHALRVTVSREVAGLIIDGITAELQREANLAFSSIQTSVIRDCHLFNGRHGLTVSGFPCNAILLENTRFGAHGDASIRLRSADLVAMIGGSIEGGSTPGAATIDVETGGAYANAISFRHVYFENTHEILLRSAGANAIGFDGCKFSGAARAGGGLAPYRFDCGQDVIEFGSNRWDLPTEAPAQALITGHNDNLRARGHQWERRAAGRSRLTTRGFAPGAMAAMVRLRAGGAEPGQGGWWRGELELMLTGREGGRLALRRTSATLFVEQSSGRLQPSLSAHDTAATAAGWSVTVAADGQSVTLGAHPPRDPAFQPIEAALLLDATAQSSGALLPLAVEPL